MKNAKLRFYLFFIGLGAPIATAIGIGLYAQPQARIALSIPIALIAVGVGLQIFLISKFIITPLRSEANERTHAMLDATPLAYAMWDESLRRIDCNAEAVKLFNLTDKQEYLDRFFDLSPKFQPDGKTSNDKMFEHIAAALRDGRTSFEWIHQDIQGRPIPTEVTMVRLESGKGCIIASYTRDLREHKLMLAEMRKNEEHTKAMLDAMPIACSLWDADGKMLDCNQRVVEIFGLTDKRDYIEHFYDLNPEFQPDGENTRDKLARLMAAALATGHQKFEWMFLTGKGEPLPVETTLVRIPWLDSHRLAAYSSDLRALKLHEHMMREAGNRTKTMEAQPLAPQDAIAAKNRFLAVLGNNIRAPMNAIVGMSGLVRTDSLSPGQLDFFKAAENKTAALIRVLPDSRYQETPIIALTANNGEETQKLLLESSVDDFLAKPIDPIELNLILAKWLPSDMIAAAGTLSREMAGE